MDNTQLLASAKETSELLQSLLETEEVKNYLNLLEKATELEKELKSVVKETKCTFEYFDTIKGSNVTITPTVKTKYNTDVADVLLEFGSEFIIKEPAVNLKMLQASPKCADYLESVAEETIVPTKRVVKN